MQADRARNLRTAFILVAVAVALFVLTVLGYLA